ncbi:UDP-N-acetylmuramoyl-L-alanyl-D-glutamate--2,6-diaminopimelate ligase [Schaalia sp. 19OD2882]|uniref:UDP-N-acetylmuramoyl-L-alanyl-D-glutamate--2, 6-diaminopimelate ligase n=1 Tax=Schaalia sp. 19OD2882 TaxID=2794089 RepID=UPI001C1ECF86|nr:UDP-N-acetylmuramoyl-L-alanyl-D-glutamate--2,6-diaminopimelate ligase [Schaalia sp. 19OD2882]QWW18677.1 UDP-N-acetylmuramoyl-L-alanyl-D-glutamate--2,6-diaminopimelate ligase [Schaalia sp. 19OD2882]
MSSVLDIRPRVRPMSLREALSRVPGAALADGDEAQWETPVSGVSVSSVDIDQGWIFVAVPGLVKHGARFAAAAVRAGAVAVVTDAEGASQVREAGVCVPVVLVDNPRSAAALVAVAVHRDPATRLLTIGITGTNGKTTTSYLTRAALSVAHPDPAICGTVESRVGAVRFDSDQTTAEAPVIQRLLDLAGQSGQGAAVVETSSHALSLNRVDGIVYDVAVFTNLQHDHLDYYGDMESYFRAKAMLFTPEHCSRGVVCVDDEWGRRLAREATVPVVTVAAFTDTPAHWQVRDITADRQTFSTVFTLVDPQGRTHRVRMPILGRVNVQNTAVALAAAVSAGISVEDAITGIEAAEQIPGRMEKVNPEPGNLPLVIVDMAHTPEGFRWTIEACKELVQRKFVMVFGTDGDRDASKREELGEMAAREADILWVTDENPRTEDPQAVRDYLLRGIARVRPDMHDVTEITTCRRDAVRKAILAAQAGDVILIPGKGAEWYQDIDGIKHPYNDVPVAREVLTQDPRARM